MLKSRSKIGATNQLRYSQKLDIEMTFKKQCFGDINLVLTECSNSVQKSVREDKATFRKRCCLFDHFKLRLLKKQFSSFQIEVIEKLSLLITN